FFSLIYLMQMKEYAEYSGDSSLLREKLGLLEDIVGVFMARIESNGLASNFKGYWNFYEWSQGLDDVVDGHCGNRERYVKSYDLPLNCHLILALENLDGIYAILGMPRRNQKAIESLRAAVHKAFYVESEGLFKSFGEGAHYSKYCNSLAVLSGCGFGHEKEICERIVTDGGMMTEVTLSKKVFEYDALLKIDWKYSEFVLSDIEKNYSYMLGRGATSFWETILGHTDFDNAGSLCHGWSAIPVYYMHILK
ncbi:MAG: hypothetical protein FWE62_00390, partial [Firmicutes bacterium]|nr:hypothetical protein [Bacillota bacterium]